MVDELDPEEETTPVCQWCEEELVAGAGFVFERDDGGGSDARDGFYCSVSCWLAAS